MPRSRPSALLSSENCAAYFATSPISRVMETVKRATPSSCSRVRSLFMQLAGAFVQGTRSSETPSFPFHSGVLPGNEMMSQSPAASVATGRREATAASAEAGSHRNFDIEVRSITMCRPCIVPPGLTGATDR